MSSLSERRLSRRNRPQPAIYRRIVTVNSFRAISLVVLLWGEYGVWWSAASCQWPDAPLGIVPEVDHSHVLLVSDPQVQDPLTLLDSWWILVHIKQWIFSSNLRKSWNAVSKLKPDLTIFMGDMLASGRYATSEADFAQYARHFKNIFTIPAAQKVAYIPGNNDIPMGTGQYGSRDIRTFYKQHFGDTNTIIDIQNHTFILLDGPGLVNEDYQRTARSMTYEEWAPLRGGAVEFVTALQPSQDVVLLTHIPLYRPDRASCGPLREKGTIRKGVGHGYQNTLGKQTTQFLLESLNPKYIFSGDARDYCEYTHSWMRGSSDPVSRAREVTVKSFSMARNIREPGFQLLSVLPPIAPPAPQRATLADRPCFFPDQYGIYTSLYVPFAILYLLALFILNSLRRHYLRSTPGIAPISTSLSSPDLASKVSPRGTPLLNPSNSDNTWSPYHTPVPVSPRSSLPSKLRTPNTSSVGPNLRAASRPGTPQGSPLLAPANYLVDEEEEDHLYPHQYATQRHPHLHDDDWTPGHEPSVFPRDVPLHSPSPYFLPAPNSKYGLATRNWSWSWTFVFRGRRRRMTIRAPQLSWETFARTFRPLWELKDTDIDFMRRGPLRSTVFDWLAVVFPSFVMWLFLVWWSS
ncbi:hypothetical protein DL96DRAFT_1535237 [Flagelloscypha sp. PMI_526]|nr:hypothetical protein DL96DRAFT_1535237 [Flagelloscypha sp. PMI_526]